MISIAFVIDTIVGPSAGTEGQLLMLLKGIDRTRFRPVLICLRQSDWLQGQTLDVPVEIVGVSSLARPALLSAMARFRALHRKHQFDIVQTFFIDANIFGTLAAQSAGILRVVSSRRNIGYWHTPFHRWVLHRLRRYTWSYLANSKAVVDFAVRTEGIDERRIRIIYNGLDVDRFTADCDEQRKEQRRQWGVEDEDILVGVVANLRPVKNLGLLVDAVGVLGTEYPRLKAVLVGEGDERPSLQAQIDRLGLGSRVLLPGPASDVAPVLAALDMAVLCSISESFSNALVEYMAAGLPVVASNVGGNGEAITTGETGILFELADPHGLVDALRAFLSDPERSAALGRAARTTARARYSRAAYIREHEAFYEEIMGAGIPG